MDKYLPLLTKMSGSVVRLALGGAFVWLIENGFIKDTQVDEIVSGIVTALGALMWIITKNIKERRVLNTAVAAPKGSTLAKVEESVSKGEFAPAMTPVNEVPVIQGTGDGR